MGQLSKSKQEWVRQESVKRNRQDSERGRTANTASGVKFKLQGTQGTNKQTSKQNRTKDGKWARSIVKKMSEIRHVHTYNWFYLCLFSDGK